MIEYLRSSAEVTGIAFDAAKYILEDVLDVLSGMPEKIDSWMADYGDSDE